MKKLMAVAALLLGAGTAFAGCFGSGLMYTCTDTLGNGFNAHRLGDATLDRGSNAVDGTDWTQTSQRIGDMTLTQGTTANGSAGSTTTLRFGDTTLAHGTGSRGNPFRPTCNQFGCR